MYWRAETAQLWRDFWQVAKGIALRDEGLTLPDLTPPEALPADWYDHWLSPDLLLSQACGLPFRDRLKDRVTYVGTLDFGLGGPEGHYHSVILLRPGLAVGDLCKEPLRFAFNSADSQSGWAARLTPGTPPLPFEVSETLETGAHALSVQALAEGRADVATIDAVSWRIISRFDPAAAALTVAGTTGPTPGQPMITSKGRDPAPLRRIIGKACTAFAPADPMAMGGPMRLTLLPLEAYFSLPLPAPPLN